MALASAVTIGALLLPTAPAGAALPGTGSATVSVGASATSSLGAHRSVFKTRPAWQGRRSPWHGATFWVDPDSSAAREARAVRTSDPVRAGLLDRIAAQPQAHWLGDWVPASAVAAEADRLVDAAGAGRSVAVLVVYAVPQRDCGGHSAGGAASDDAYRAWVGELARGLGGRRALVVLEPDALALTDCLSSTDRARRTALLADARAALEAAGGVVYVDAGHSAWHSAQETALRLRAVGARRFALNTANFRRTADEVAYGQAVSRLLGGAGFVVDTGRNGAGPYDGDTAWCNPPDRALGTPPTGRSGLAGVDALLWVKRPGESDGTCRGGPPAGQWWGDYAVGLAARAG